MSTRRVWTSLTVAVALGGVMVVVLWGLQRQLIYFPGPEPPPAASVIDGARDVTLHTSDGLELTAWFVPADDADLAVLLAPGNAGNRASRAGLAEELRERGLAVLLLEYRGYGGNPGSPSEDGLARDADAAVAALTELGHPPERTLYLGESLGTGVVAALQDRHPPAGVLLRSPFPTFADVGTHHYPYLPVRTLLRDRYPVLEHLRESRVPMTVVHGEADTIVPPELSRRVADGVPRLVEHVELPGVGHNDPEMFGAPVADAVRRLADEVR